MKKVLILMVVLAFWGCIKNTETEIKPDLKIVSYVLEKKLFKSPIPDGTSNIMLEEAIKNNVKLKNESSKDLKVNKICLCEVKYSDKIKEYESVYNIEDEKIYIEYGNEKELNLWMIIGHFIVYPTMNLDEEMKKCQKDVEDMKGIKIRIVYEIEGQEKSQEEYLSF